MWLCTTAKSLTKGILTIVGPFVQGCGVTIFQFKILVLQWDKTCATRWRPHCLRRLTSRNLVNTMQITWNWIRCLRNTHDHWVPKRVISIQVIWLAFPRVARRDMHNTPCILDDVQGTVESRNTAPPFTRNTMPHNWRRAYFAYDPLKYSTMLPCVSEIITCKAPGAWFRSLLILPPRHVQVTTGYSEKFFMAPVW